MSFPVGNISLVSLNNISLGISGYDISLNILLINTSQTFSVKLVLDTSQANFTKRISKLTVNTTLDVVCACPIVFDEDESGNQTIYHHFNYSLTTYISVLHCQRHELSSSL